MNDDFVSLFTFNRWANARTPFLKIPRLGRSFAASSPYTLGTGPGPSQARP
jgi:hypothetical protein